MAFTFARNFGIRYSRLPAGEDDTFFLCLVDEKMVAQYDVLFPQK